MYAPRFPWILKRFKNFRVYRKKFGVHNPDNSSGKMYAPLISHLFLEILKYFMTFTDLLRYLICSRFQLEI
jgi:hypothetical protein